MAEKVITPYQNIPYLPLENEADDTRHGAQFFRNVKQLSVGFGSKVFRVDRDGMWAGAEDMASAPWSVDWDGHMTANSITLSGYIPTGGALGDIGVGNITGTYIANGAIVSDKIAANAVIASKISVSSLSAINANLGSITAGSLNAVTITGSTITGTTLTTASSGQRVILYSTLASYYNSSGTLIASTYANSSSFLLKGEQSGSNIYLDAGSSGVVAFLTGGTLRLIFDYGNGYFAPTSSGNIDLGNIVNKWRDLWINGSFEYQAVTQPIVYYGNVYAGSIYDDNTTWSCTHLATGRYRINHSLGTSTYAVNVTPIAGVVKNITVESWSSTSFTVRIANLADTLEDNDFFFIVTVAP